MRGLSPYSLNQLISSKMVRLHRWADSEKTKASFKKACKCSECYINICMVKDVLQHGERNTFQVYHCVSLSHLLDFCSCTADDSLVHTLHRTNLQSMFFRQKGHIPIELNTHIHTFLILQSSKQTIVGLFWFYLFIHVVIWIFVKCHCSMFLVSDNIVELLLIINRH